MTSTTPPEATMSLLLGLRARGIRDTALLRAFERVPRIEFVGRHFADLATTDMTLPIACGQSQSSPSLMAEMIGALDIKGDNRVLEIGTGSGYGTAILEQLASEVTTIERYRSLMLEARGRLDRLGLGDVTCLHGDGMAISDQAVLYERILVNGTFEKDPAALLRHLSPGGVLVGILRNAQGSALVRYSRKGDSVLPLMDRLGPMELPLLAEGISVAL